MERKKILFSFVVFFFLFILVCGFIICLFIGLQSVFEDPPEETVSEPILYRYYEYDSRLDSTSKGFVTLPSSFEGLVGENGMSYESDDNTNQVLISKFDDDSREYMCSGVCVCVGGGRRSNTGVKVFSKGITFLVAAVSSYIAYNQAKDYFEDQCKTKFGDDCDDEDKKLISEVDDCKDGSEMMERMRKEYFEPYGDSMENFGEDDDRLLHFFCHGQCSPNRLITVKPELKRLQEGECKKRKFETFITTSCLKYDDIDECEKKLVRYAFKREYMDTFCREHGVDSLVCEGKEYSCPPSEDEDWGFIRKLCTSVPEKDIKCRIQNPPTKKPTSISDVFRS